MHMYTYAYALHRTDSHDTNRHALTRTHDKRNFQRPENIRRKIKRKIESAQNVERV